MPSLLGEDHESVKGWLADLEAKAAPAPISPGFGGGYYTAYTAADGLAPSPADKPLYLNVVVAGCLGWLKRNFPVADLHVVEQEKAGDGAEIPDHPAIALLDRPNPIDDFFSFWSSFLLSDVIDGNTFFVKVRNKLGIHSLWWVPPWDVTLVPAGDRDADRPIAGYDVRTYGALTRYAPEDVIHIKDGKDPYNPLRGLADLKAGIRSATSIDRAEYYTCTLMRNMGGVAYMLSPSESGMTIGPENVGVLREQYVAATTGMNNGKPFVSPQGLKADRMGLSPEEMALDTILNFPAAAVSALIGVSLMSAGFPDPGKTYSNLQESNRMSWQNGLVPRQARAAEAFDRQCPELIHPTRERLKWKYDHVKALQDDWATKIDGLTKATGKPFMTRNEARDQVHLEAIDGWDKQDEEPPPPPVVAPPALPGKEPQRALPPPKGKMADPFERKASGNHLLMDAAASLGLAKVYRDGSITPEQRRELCHAVSLIAGRRLRDMGEALAGELEPEEKGLTDAIGRFFGRVSRTIRTGALAATLALVGPGDIGKEGREALAADVEEQERYLGGFEAAVRDGSQATTGIAGRAEMYGAATYEVGQNVARKMALALGVKFEKRVLASADSACPICVEEADKGWQPAGTLKALGDSYCHSRCRCHFEWSDEAGTTVIPSA